MAAKTISKESGRGPKCTAVSVNVLTCFWCTWRIF